MSESATYIQVGRADLRPTDTAQIDTLGNDDLPEKNRICYI